MSQFSDHATRATLGRYLKLPGIYPAGRLDADSEGLMLLTDDGRLQHQISHPDHGKLKTYLVQVEGLVQTAQLHTLRQPLDLGDFITRGSRTVRIAPPDWLWPRDPPVRERSHIPTSWLAITISEGKNRQVRRMTAAAGLPTLRLVRTAIGPFSLSSHPLLPGEWRVVTEQEWQAPANQR